MVAGRFGGLQVFTHAESIPGEHLPCFSGLKPETKTIIHKWELGFAKRGLFLKVFLKAQPSVQKRE